MDPRGERVPATVATEAAVMTAMAQAIQYLTVTATMRTTAATATYGSRPTLIITTGI